MPQTGFKVVRALREVLQRNQHVHSLFLRVDVSRCTPPTLHGLWFIDCEGDSSSYDVSDDAFDLEGVWWINGRVPHGAMICVHGVYTDAFWEILGTVHSSPQINALKVAAFGMSQSQLDRTVQELTAIKHIKDLTLNTDWCHGQSGLDKGMDIIIIRDIVTADTPWTRLRLSPLLGVEGLCGFIEGLSQNTILQQLELELPKLLVNDEDGARGLEALGKTLQRHPSLESVSLEFFGGDAYPRSAEYLYDLIACNPRLIRVTVPIGNMTAARLKCMCSSLHIPRNPIHNLVLRESGDSFFDHAFLIDKGLRDNSKIECLTLNFVRVTLEDAKVIGDFLRDPSCNLRGLSLTYAFSTPDRGSAISIILNATAHSRSLKRLEIYDKCEVIAKFDELVERPLSLLLQMNTVLKKLHIDLGWYPVHSFGKGFVQALRSNQTLSSLDLGVCGFKDGHSVRELIDLLVKCDVALRKLRISTATPGEPLGTSGCKAILGALFQIQGLKRLTIRTGLHGESERINIIEPVLGMGMTFPNHLLQQCLIDHRPGGDQPLPLPILERNRCTWEKQRTIGFQFWLYLRQRGNFRIPVHV